MTATQVLDREFLTVRARLIDLAAALDRIGRTAGPAPSDARLTQIRRSLQVLATDGPDRAEQIQMVFSLPYEDK
ncbi:MAG: hypothetical protein ABSG68_12485 [Thermoguttaceae bacterium]|jgi:hypothetical protein